MPGGMRRIEGPSTADPWSGVGEALPDPRPFVGPRGEWLSDAAIGTWWCGASTRLSGSLDLRKGLLPFSPSLCVHWASQLAGMV